MKRQRKLEGPKEVFESLYRSLGQRQSQAVFSQLLKSESLRPTLTVSKFAALVVAVLVHATTLLCLILSVLVLAWAWPDFWNILLLVAPCFWLTWTMRPRFPKMPRFLVDRDEFPALYGFVDSVAAMLGTPGVDGIVINEHFNAGFGQVGWQRKRILWLGLPLWCILDEQEKAALVAHELAHDVNGDPNRGLLVSSAVYTLARWYRFLRPAYVLDVAPGAGVRGLLMIPFNIFMFCLSTLPWLVGHVLIHLLWHDSQRAEYLADHLAATVSGTGGMLSLLTKLYLGRVFGKVVDRSKSQHRNVNLFEEFRLRVAETSQDELEWIKDEDRMEGGRLDITHPPTAYRLEILERRAPTSQIPCLPDYSEEIDKPFEVNAQRMQSRLLDEYRLHL